MEKEKSTEVKCKTCDESKQVKTTERIVLILGTLLLFFGLYGIVSFIKDLISIF